MMREGAQKNPPEISNTGWNSSAKPHKKNPKIILSICWKDDWLLNNICEYRLNCAWYNCRASMHTKTWVIVIDDSIKSNMIN